MRHRKAGRKLNRNSSHRKALMKNLGRSQTNMTGGLSGLTQSTELRQRIFFVVFALIVFRLGSFITLPGIDPSVMKFLFEQQRGSILDMFNMFSGGALGRMTIFALTILPYISASIIMQLMTSISPQMSQLKKDGEAGRKTINQYTRYLTVLLATVQAYGFAVALESTAGASGSLVNNPGVFFKITTVTTIVAGTIFANHIQRLRDNLKDNPLILENKEIWISNGRIACVKDKDNKILSGIYKIISVK